MVLFSDEENLVHVDFIPAKIYCFQFFSKSIFAIVKRLNFVECNQCEINKAKDYSFTLHVKQWQKIISLLLNSYIKINYLKT